MPSNSLQKLNTYTGDGWALTSTPHTRANKDHNTRGQTRGSSFMALELTATLRYATIQSNQSTDKLIQQQHSPRRQAVARTGRLGGCKSHAWPGRTSRRATSSPKVGRRSSEGGQMATKPQNQCHHGEWGLGNTASVGISENLELNTQ